jgi:enterochelin esterase-like enzyme
MQRLGWVLVFIAALPPTSGAQSPRTRGELLAVMKERGPAGWTEELAAQIRALIPEQQLQRGAVDAQHLTALWTIDAGSLGDAPRVVSDDGRFSLQMTRVGTSSVYAGLADLAPGTILRWSIESKGRRLGAGGLDVYARHPDEEPRQGVPKGTLRQMRAWRSQVFEGTTRDWWVYVPAQLRPGTRAAVTVFQDGASYKDYVPAVFDNLIDRGEIPVMVGVFISPGVKADGAANRSFEYDTLSPRYASFLIDEILPEVEKLAALRADPGSRAIVGASSGGICAFTVAWERPDQFGKVVSWIGSFTNIAAGATRREGGHNYPALIRKTPKKPIRVFLQDGSNDLDNEHGNWWLGNLQMEKSLAFAGYDYKVAWGEGFHSHRHGRSIFGDTLRWLWRDHRQIGSQ